MDIQKVDMFMMSSQKYFPGEKLMFIREKLLAADPQKEAMLMTIEQKDPTTYLIISIFLGSWGVDRFMLGDTGMGILKLLTCGVCGILTIIDWFTIMNRTKELNFQHLMALL